MPPRRAPRVAAPHRPPRRPLAGLLTVVATLACLGSAAAQRDVVHLAPNDPWPDPAPGSTVVLAPGTYDGPWTVTTPDVVIEGTGATLRGPAEGSALELHAPGVVVHDLTVEGGGTNPDLYAPDAAAWLLDCHGCVLEGFTASGTPAGLRIEASRDVRIDGATLRGGPEGPGVTAYQAPNLALVDLNVRGFLDGAYVERSDGARVVGGHLRDARRYGLHVMFGSETVLRNVAVADGGVGSAVMYARDARIEGVRFTGHRGPLAYGMLLQEMDGATVRDVALDGNTVGALIVSSRDVHLTGGAVTGNGTGLLVRRAEGAGASAVRAAGVTFAGNVGDVAVDDPAASVALRGNAFDAASPLDRDRDGVSDVAHLPTSTFALLTTRTPDLSLFALHPGVTLWEAAERRVPALRTARLRDRAPRLAEPAVGAAPSGAGAALAGLVAAAGLALGASLARAGWAPAPPGGGAA
ncbi:MAG: right-handed parallel beta-helix repeat-containing protein [Trueperaceae bacterium]|nr:right-handed parallel beta-helix repeat-containing protein [Trueperaceae bacterium]